MAVLTTAGKAGLATALALVLAAGAGQADGPRLATDGTRFTVNGKPTFLLGVSYYAGLGAPEAVLRRDLERAGGLARPSRCRTGCGCSW